MERGFGGERELNRIFGEKQCTHYLFPLIFSQKIEKIDKNNFVTRNNR